MAKRWCLEPECGEESWGDDQTDGGFTAITTQENVKKVHDLVLEERWVTIKQVVEDTDLSYHVMHNVIPA